MILIEPITFFAINNPPLSPSTKRVTSFSLDISATIFGIFVPFIAIAFFIPALRRLTTSALPSTTIISLLISTSGPAAIFSSPISLTLTVFEWSITDCSISLISGVPELNFSINALALSRIKSLLLVLTSSIPSISNFASHGPTLSIVSTAAAINVVSALSIEVGIVTIPVVMLSLTSISASILPIFPFF